MRTLTLALVLSFTSAAMAQQDAADAFVESIEQAHNKAAWYNHPAVQADIEVYFGDELMLAGTMTFEPWVGRSRLDMPDGTTLVFDGEQAYVSPADAEVPMARFHLLTWPYFMALPFKLGDPGAHVQVLDPPDTARMTFDPGTGDAPDDWYVLYRDPDSHRLSAAAYIVTYFGPVEEAEKEPHAIRYLDEADVEGVQLAMNWTFHLWDEAQGVHGDPIGRAALSNVRFIEPAEGLFEPETGARIDAPWGAGTGE